MKATLNQNSIKQKEIVKATIFLTVGMLIVLIKIVNFILTGL